MKKVLAVIVNYGEDQLNYLQQVLNEFKSFKNYQVTTVVHSNIQLPDIKNIDRLHVIEMDDYQYLPMTCRQVIDDNAEFFDYYIFSENDHLWKEHHVDKFIEYDSILPEDRIAGLIQYEANETGRYYPAYHAHYEWDWNSVEEHGGKKFAHFTNVHQASFIITKKQLSKLRETYNFSSYFPQKSHYSTKCRTNTDIYMFGGMKKLICISEFEDNLIHHLPNVYIDGAPGYRREDGKIVNRIKQRSEENRMQASLSKLLG